MSSIPLSGAQLIFQMVNRANPSLKLGPLSASNVTMGAATPLNGDLTGKNSKITLTAIPGSGYSGSCTLTFNRLDINQAFIQLGIPALSFQNNSYGTSTDFIDYLNAAHGLNLQASDIVEEVLPAADTVGNISYTLKMDPSCLCFTGQLPLTITPKSIQLFKAMVGQVLNGFIPPDTTKVNLASAMTGTVLGLFTVAQLQGKAT